MKLHFWYISPLILSLILTAIILTVLRYLPPRLPLFYSLPWGDSQLADHRQFLIIPATISIVTLLNLIISWQLHHSQTFFKKALLSSSIIISLILITTFIKIVLMFV